MISHAQLNRWLVLQRENDPGFAQFRQAARTTIAAMAAPLAVWYAQHWQPALSGIAPLSVAFLTGMLMIMTTYGETRRIQKQSFILAGGAGLLMVLLEKAVHHSYLLEVSVFMLVSFVVFYIRRFGMRYTGISIYAMTIFLMSTVMNTHAHAWPGLVGGVSIGIGVTYIVNFYLLPDRPLKRFLDSIPPFLRKSSQVLEYLEALLQGATTPAETKRLMHDALQDLQLTVLVSENLLGNLRIDTHAGRAPFRKCALAQYRVSSTLLIIGDHLQHAMNHHGLPHPVIQTQAKQVLQDIRLLLVHLADHADDATDWPDTDGRLRHQLDDLTALLESSETQDTFHLFYLLRTVFALRGVLDALGELQQNWNEARRQL
ncbi:MAG: hypothetical protein EOM20_02550 [Spartobacteria bacterium]|nr:hypothetical protein [Spartobacteria bacterium]